MTFADLSPTPLAPGASAQDAVDGITAAARSSFSIGMKLLARPRRRAMRAIYAFCRVVDDIADGDLPVASKRALLAEWRDEIQRLYQGDPVSAVGLALADPVRIYSLPKAEFLAMIDGMEMDANGPIHAPDKATLMTYNRRVAGSVGLLSMRVFGAWKGAISEHFALELANALQLTNILRDVEEDAAIGRIYLPLEVLENANVDPQCSTIAKATGLADARAAVGEWAGESFSQARAAISAHDRAALAPALAMYGVYYGYFKRMKALDWEFTGSIEMGTMTKIRLGLAPVLFGVGQGSAV